MKIIAKRLISLLFALSLVCWQTATVFVEGTESASPGLSSDLDSSIGESQEDLDSGSADILWVEVSSFEELFDALDTGSTEPLYIRATQDLIVPVGETRVFGLGQWVQVDLGPHTLYVDGTLKLGKDLTLIGAGGENGLVRVRPGGRAEINETVFKNESGYAAWQEEGASLIVWSSPSEAFHYAEKAVAIPDYLESKPEFTPLAVVHDGQTLADALPETDPVCLVQNGKISYLDIAVDWNLADSQIELDARIRTIITGSYPDASTFAPPYCLVTFQNGNPAVLLNAYGMVGMGDMPKVRVQVELIKPELGCRFEWSQDGMVWQNAESVKARPDASGQLTYLISFPSDEQPVYPYYLSAVVDDPDRGSGYSDIIVIREAAVQCDSGGNRGGGTDLDPPETLPPPTIPDPLPDTPEQTPPGGSTTESDSDSSGGATPPSGSDTLPGGQTKLENITLPPILSPVNTTETAAGKADTFTPQTESGTDVASEAAQTEQRGTPLTSPEQSEPVQEALVPAAPEPSPASNRAVGQVAAGTAATGGVIALTMSYPRWGKRLAAFLGRLVGKH